MCKKSIHINIILICFTCIILTGCITTKVTNQQLISANQRATGKIESTVESIDSIITSSSERIESITERSKQIEDGIDRLEFLFNCYERESRRIIDELIEERDRLKAYLKDNVDPNYNLHLIHSSKDSGDDYKN
jgi:Mg2+ and Co2+ transporter CorA